jgi:uncharacterized protein (DUF1810 family)
MGDIYRLQRFIEAQDKVYGQVLEELSAGEKSSHWMWYVFPQIKGLGRTAMSQKYAISCLQEAEAYLAHPVLGPRLRECTDWVVKVEGRSAERIFHYPDNLKFHSCMTLFMKATADNQVFKDALRKYFADKPDSLTLDILSGQ